jgi:Uncharacterized protein conserved in bacteria
MKETVLDVLMYLFENYHETEFEDSSNRPTLLVELEAAGFPADEIGHAFSWLEGLASSRGAAGEPSQVGALRLYTRSESERLSPECRGLLMHLEQLGILTPTTRELVIGRLLAIEDEIDLERAKWVCLLVLVNQPGEEEAAVHLEDMVYYQGDFLH